MVRKTCADRHSGPRPSHKAKAKEQRTLHEGRLDSFFNALVLDLDACPCYTETNRAAVGRLKERMRKRAGYMRSHLDRVAKDDFIRLNANVGFLTPQLDPLVLEHARDFIFHVLNKYSRSIDVNATPDEVLVLGKILSNWRFGPKASNGVSGRGAVEKMDQPMTCTEQAEPLVRLIRLANPYLDAFDARESGIRLITGSKLTTVPKNEDVVRTIATEPSGNMAMQLAAGRFVEDALRLIGLDIRHQQPRNKYLARKGSVLGLLATIDLKSASDFISRSLIQQLWPESWFTLLTKIRSPVATIDGREVRLEMMSTMGNGTTFPVMTLTLLSLVYANRRCSGGPRRFIDWGCTAVFGDDIIVPTHEYEGLCKTLADAGLVVNHEKSYAKGPFRESCGGDYYLGEDITPFYVENLRNPAELYIALNKLMDWASRHRIPLTRSARYLRSQLVKVRLVPEWSQPYSGLRSAQCPRRYKELVPNQLRKEYTGVMHMPLVCGGFLQQREDGVFTYVSSGDDCVTYVTREAWLPEGYQDGWDPLSGCLRSSSYRSLLIELSV